MNRQLHADVLHLHWERYPQRSSTVQRVGCNPTPQQRRHVNVTISTLIQQWYSEVGTS